MTNTSNLNLTKGSIPPLLKYKIVFLGDQAVGKSCIINRFIYDIFDNGEHRPTIGIDFISQNIYLEEKTIRLQLWDTAGQERFRSLIPNYIRDSAAIVLVYDVTNKQSFDNLPKWLEDIGNQRSNDVIVCLVANKIDLTTKQLIHEGRQFSSAHNLLFAEVSAKTGVNIQEMFKLIAGKLPGIANQSKSTTVMTQAEQKKIVLQPGKTTQVEAEKTKCCN